MATKYVAKRRKKTPAHPVKRVSYKHHVAWGVVCLLLGVVVVGLMSYAQTLAYQNTQLRSQLIAQKTIPTTCKVTGAWPANTAKQLSMATTSGPRNYFVHLPKDFSDNKYYPLVMFYSGKGASAQDVEAAFGMDDLPAVVVYPSPTASIDGSTAWQGAPYSSDADDVGFTSAILDKLQTDLCIDRTHIYAAGFSNGGAFASLLSCKLPGRFAAYAVISGAMYYPDGGCTPTTSSPLLNVHGDNDFVVPYDGSLIRRLPQIDSWTEMRASAEHCSQPAITYPDVTTVVTTWDKCRDRGVVQNVRIIGGKHAWGQISDTRLWQFLSRFSL